MSEYPNKGSGFIQYVKDLFSGKKYEDATIEDPWQEQSRRNREKNKDSDDKKKGK